MWIIVIVLVLLLGTAGLIIGLVVSNNSSDSDANAWMSETFSYDAEL